MNSFDLNDLSTFFLNLTKEDIPINDRPKAVFSKLEEYLKEKHLLDKVVFDFVDIMHFCVFELALSHQTYFSKPNGAYKFVEQYENLSVYTLASGAFVNSGAFSMLKPESPRRKRHDELQILAKDTVDLYITFGFLEEALRKYLWFTNEHSMNLGPFEKHLVDSIRLIAKRLRSDRVQEAIEDNKTDGFPNNEYFEHLANEKFEEYMDNQNLDFLYQIHQRLDRKNLRHYVNTKLGILINSLLDIIVELEKKEAGDIIGDNDHYQHLISNEIKDYIKNDLSKKVAGFIYCLVDQEGIDEQDYTKNYSDPIVNSIWEDVNYLYKLTKDSNEEAIMSLVSQLDVFQKEYLILLSSKDQYDYRSFEGSYSAFLSDLVNKCIIEKNEKLFKEELDRRFKEFNDEDLEQLCKHSMDFLNTYCSVPAMTIAELDSKVPTYDYTHHPFHHTIDEMYDFIKNNKEICSAIALSQKLIEELKIGSQGDYICYNVGHIKAVERLLKEILVKYYRNSIYKADKSGMYFTTPITPIPTTIDDLCKKPNALELGAVAFAMAHILCLDPAHSRGVYHGIFYAPHTIRTDADGYRRHRIFGGDIPFWRHFVSESRNGYFHIEQIESYEKSVEISRLTSYWLTRVIDEILDHHPGTRLS